MADSRPRLRIALTGFGPFPGAPFNASAALVQDLTVAPPHGLPGLNLYSAVLPVDWNRAASEARRLFAAVDPHLILHFGVSPCTKGFVIETQAFNFTSPRADNADARPERYYLRRGAPLVLRTRFHTKRLAQRLRHAGFQASTSNNAGRYLCNAIYYDTLHYCRSMAPEPSALFVHIPMLTGAQIESGSWETIRIGSTHLLQLAVQMANTSTASGR